MKRHRGRPGPEEQPGGAEPLGWIQCCGTVFPIIRIEITGGEMILVGERPGPLAAGSGPATIYGSDGIEWPAVTDDNRCSWPRVLPGEMVALPLHLRCPGSPRRILQGQVEGSEEHPAVTGGPRAIKG